MNCLIIEDQPPAQRILKRYIDEIGMLQLRGCFSNALEAIEYLKSESVDLIFLDIHLPKISGIDFLKTISNRPHVILTTAFAEYALESYELNVVDYLLKPFSFERFVKAIAKVPQQHSVQQLNKKSDQDASSRTDLFIKSGYDLIKIKIDEILFIKSDADYTEIHTVLKKHLSSEPLRYWLENLDKNQFARIHKSYIINTAKIEKISGNQVYLVNEEIIPIGRAFKESFIDNFLK